MSLLHHETLGGDVSEFQKGLRLPDVWTFVYAKCTEGHRTKDSEYAGFKAQAEEQGKLFAAYHFLRSDSSPRAQAEWFMENEPDKRIPVIVDVEESPGSSPGVPHLELFAHTVRNAGHGASMYFPRWWWERTGSRDLSHLHMALIASEYPSTTPGSPHDLYRHVPDSYWGRYGNVTPTILQYADSGRVQGYGGSVDLDAFRGTRKELAETGIFHDFGHRPQRHSDPAPEPAPQTPEHHRKPLQEQIDVLRARVRALETKEGMPHHG